MGPWHNFYLANSFGVGPTNELKLCLVPILKYCSQFVSSTPENYIFLCICIITCEFPYMGAGNVMYCTVQVHSFNLLSVTHPHLKKMPHLCLDSLQKEACLARPARGAVDHSWQLVSPVTPYPHYIVLLHSQSFTQGEGSKVSKQ